ncbi:MAG: Asp-tRNA(Asn)/Glu-tRNA(Gln) amidotransferase subunit GatA [Flavobacteriia bacterium]|nr:Asp-tRNA(Asn)/Glu-tRNA(Gln) amidotransferase subunit GatA [Flavobacteriia bacterium]OIP46105.1 MAG: glutamyl-tRNA amidotransferase [Flavobacteriaceae bacterium CG2_30_31_66]PIV96910.1 MAG: Asp-tRNA(Asn)/Glu-tRNA(Gln) amidotransferase subunit GatA [Flavobacteriaceae bacterium CG17_big_fil_post_rev_8_21_14_2_50_31_13]PIX13082.1 MAG: Asp-tRNA(Asn)/Glu-tRNA(Gln) amidotransferase subunit GatA [Flavobacteriaceae bacterium CG_4_8_14_3_um_filter_31_8]PIY15216.1 MAG: Asp-tRNA(Asn)/Glu-tRNA(Gln) amido
MESQIRKIHQQLVDQKITCTTLIQEKLAALKPNSHNTVNSLLEDFALEKAKKVDEKIKNRQEIGLLEGIPFGVKDVYMLQGTFTTASSDFLKNYKAAYTATAIQKLIDAGAIPIVKENCDSFGHGSSSENTIFGAVKNAINPALVAGGSSGGSAVNVAKQFTVFSIGGDTGGSVRQPSGYNKVYGLKPTYGRVSRFGLLAYASSTDCVGPIATSIEDIRIVLNTISGIDVKDQTTYKSDIISDENISTASEIKAIGYFKNFIENNAIDSEIKADFLAAIEKIKSKGIEVKELDFFDSETLVSTYYTLVMAETASNLSRLDGTNYGNRMEGKNLKDTYSITRSENFSEETKRRIVGGNQVLSQGFSDEIYLKAINLKNEISENFERDFQEVAIILSPVTPKCPPKIGDSLKDPLAMYLSDAYTVGFSLGQLPTLTIPQGTSTGLQISAAKTNDEILLKFANFLKEVL